METTGGEGGMAIYVSTGAGALPGGVIETSKQAPVGRLSRMKKHSNIERIGSGHNKNGIF